MVKENPYQPLGSFLIHLQRMESLILMFTICYYFKFTNKIKIIIKTIGYSWSCQFIFRIDEKTVICWYCELTSLYIIIMTKYFVEIAKRISSFLGPSDLSCMSILPEIELVLDIIPIFFDNMKRIPIISC